ncbi:MAG: aldo/keto reductase [Oscillospiraceae bacterium]
MRYRKLGMTDLVVSELGFGTIPILSGNVPVLPKYYSPNVPTAIDIMNYAYNFGCNLYDTAIPSEYGDAEYKLGQFTKKVGRENIIISDKARCFDGNQMYKAVLQSCENLNTIPDIYFVHQVDFNNQDEVFSPYGSLSALYDLKREGKIRYTGIASHYYDILYRGAKDYRVDVLQGSGNIFERGMLDRIADEPIFKTKGYILNKVYGAGVLINPFTIEELISGILSYPISSALIGLGTFQQVDTAMEYEFSPSNPTFEFVLDTLKTQYNPIPCDRCQRCKCIYGWEVHTLFRQYNYYHLGKDFWALKKMSLNIKEVADSCKRCTSMECNEMCPRGVHIPEEVLKIDNLVRNHINYNYRNNL